MNRLACLAKTCCIVLTLMLATGLSSQEQASQSTPIFTSKTNLVLIPVIVEDGGKHVPGLTKDDFEIRENGKEKPVAVFEVVTTGSNLMTRTPSRNGVYTNAVTGDASPKRLSIFALDTVNTPFLDQKYAREELIKFLAHRIDGKEPCALISIQSNGIKILHDFSSDPAVLVAALKKAVGQIPTLSAGTSAQEVEQSLGGSAVQPTLSTREFETQESNLEDFIGGSDLGFATFATANKIRVTLEAFQHVAEAFAGVPGRKSLIWATASFPFGLDPTTGTLLSPRVFSQGATVSLNTQDATGGLPALPTSTAFESSNDLKALAPQYERTIQMLNDANISIYPVDARGLMTFFPDATTSRIAGLQSFNSALFESSRETMEGFAEMTGGKAFYNRNDLDVAFGKAADDSDSYYMIGYYLDKNAKQGWHKLQVKTKRGGHVRARNGFFVTPENKQTETRRMDVKLALASPLDYTGIPISVRWAGTQAAGAKKKVSFQIVLPPSAGVVDESNNNHLSLEMVAVARMANGQPADQFAEHLETNLKPENMPALHKDGVNYNSNIQVPPGEYTVRFVVRDDISGRLGSVSAPLTVAP